MELSFALLADHFAETKEGKLVIVGVFDNIRTTSFPTVHPMLHLVARWETALRSGTRHRARVALISPSGQTLTNVESSLDFIPQGPGRKLRGQLVASFAGLRFPDPGVYHFQIAIDDRTVAQVPFELILTELQ